MTAARRIAIGDIHGCINALDCLLQAIAPTRRDELIVLGDFIDQGNESRLVIDRLIELRARCQLIALLGNHEEMLLAALHNRQALRYWEACGGHATLNSYYFGATLKAVPAEHLRFLRGCPDYHETDEQLFAHANYDPDRPLESTESLTLRWDLLDPQLARPHFSGKTAYVGHTEQPDGEVLDRGFVKCIDTACWRYGWLTAIEVASGRLWQASRFGQLRLSGEPAIGPTSRSASELERRADSKGS